MVEVVLLVLVGDAVDELVVDELLAPDLQRDVVVVVLGREAPRDDAAEHHGDGGHVAGVAAALVHEARQVDDDGAVRERGRDVEERVDGLERADVLDAAGLDAPVAREVLVGVEAQDDEVVERADGHDHGRGDAEERDVAVVDRARHVLGDGVLRLVVLQQQVLPLGPRHLRLVAALAALVELAGHERDDRARRRRGDERDDHDEEDVVAQVVEAVVLEAVPFAADVLHLGVDVLLDEDREVERPVRVDEVEDEEADDELVAELRLRAPVLLLRAPERHASRVGKERAGDAAARATAIFL